MSDLIGSVLGPYQITQKLGRGGMADVYKAWHRELELHRAIKVIRPEFVTSGDFRLRFQKEAQGVARLQHPNIVQVHDFGVDDGHYYMVMEYVEGTTLKAALVRDGRFPVDRTIHIIRALSAALETAHARDLIHRDIKPDNIMLTPEGRPVLMDFGIAKLLTENTALTQTGMGIGTPAYMAPEQAKGLPLSAATDIYALSIVLFEMLTGRVPYDADTPIAVMLKAISDPMPMPRSLNPDISEALQGVILKGAAKDPVARYPNVRAFVDALDAAVQSPQPAFQPGPDAASAASPPAVSRRRAWLLPGAAALLVIVAAGIWLLGDPGDNPALATTPGIETKDDPADAHGRDSPATSGMEGLADREATADPAVAWQWNGDIGADQGSRRAVHLREGETIFLNVLATSATTDFVLQSPGGRSEVFNTYRTDGPFVIRHTGEHSLGVHPRDHAPARVHAELLRLAEPEIYGGSIYPGDTFSGVTDLPGQTILRHVDLPAGAAVYLQVARSATTADFTLVSPDERTPVFSSYRDAGPVTTRQAGVHALRIDPRDGLLADFEAALFVVEPAVIEQGASPVNALFTDRTTVPGQTISRTFELAAGDTVFLQVPRSAVTTDFTLRSPGGPGHVLDSYRSAGPFGIPADGTYILLADPRDAGLADHDVRLVRVSPPVIDGGTVIVGGTTSGVTHLPGQTVEFSVDLTAGDQLAFAATQGAFTVDYRLLDADRTLTVFDTYNSATPPAIPATGRYFLVADPRDDGVGAFEFRLAPVAPQQP